MVERRQVLESDPGVSPLAKSLNPSVGNRNNFRDKGEGTLFGGPVVKTLHSRCRGAQVRSLVEELISYMPDGKEHRKGGEE